MSPQETAPEDCQCDPIEIPDHKNLIRGVYYYVHIDSKGVLKWQLYEPTRNTDEISVMRADCMSPTECKSKAVSLEKKPMKLYRGLAVLKAGAVRALDMGVSDSREQYCGHAHISIGMPIEEKPNGEPRNVEEVPRVKELARNLLRLTRYHADPTGQSTIWPAEIPLTSPQD